MSDSRSTVWPPKRFLLFFVLLHSATSVSLSLLLFRLGMARFDTGAPQPAAEAALEYLCRTLQSPLFALVGNGDPLFWGLIGYIPLLANSTLWALCVWWAIALGRRVATTRPQ
jgi:hypothetical protein